MFHLLYSDRLGNLLEEPGLAALGRSWDEVWEIASQDMIPLPRGTTLAMLPGRRALGMEPRTGEALCVWACREGSEARQQMPGWAVGALLPTGFTRTLLPAYDVCGGTAPNLPTLPLFGYTAVGVRHGKPYVAAVATDKPSRWDPRFYNAPELGVLVERRLEASPNNRILRQLAKCSLEYRCPTAQNIFQRRWEGGIPVSPECSARCIGCISLQPSECCPSPQGRIGFVPTEREIVEIAVPHLSEASHAIISFGQGCEGEPLLQGDLIARAIRHIRAEVSRGILNVNTNAGLTGEVAKVCGAGLDSMRVSLISAREEIYDAYHRPHGYGLDDVLASIAVAKDAGVFVSLNLLVFPGLSDREEELDALGVLIENRDIDMIQLRNLNIDPDVLTRALPDPHGKVLGIGAFIREMESRFPRLRLGSFSPSRDELEVGAGSLKGGAT